MIKTLDLKKRFKVVVPKEWDKRTKGKYWEDLSAPLFRKQRWQVTNDIEFAGMQADIWVNNLDTNESLLIECKFQQDLIECKVLSQLVGSALAEDAHYAYLLSTSELNPRAKAHLQKYENKIPKLVFWGPDRLAEVFMDLNNIKIPELNHKNIGHVETITLLATHTKEFFWVVEEIGNNGEPFRALIFPISEKENSINIDEWSAYFSRNELSWQGLEIVDGSTLNSNDHEKRSLISEANKITVSKINHADSFDDYHRPCRPQDFVGRPESQAKFWKFVQCVKDNNTQLRIVCFSGGTGLGKSSLVLKLKADCNQKDEYKDSFYFYDVDVTSVNPEKATLFVISVIRKAFQETIDMNFIELPDHKISIESTEPPFFASQSIQLALQKLKQSRKVLVIFFDQFEEILAKDSLNCLYDLFKRAAYEVDSLKENIVLGFCWRTDVITSIKHKAYETWNQLERVRKDIEFGDFTNQDSLDVLKLFNEYLHQDKKRLEPKLEKWLLENCQNSPWLLKKICGDIYNQHLNISEIVSNSKKTVLTKFDIKQIFEKDKIRYITSKAHNDCLNYIAQYSPVRTIDVCENFESNIINSLLASKLVIETGENYKIYWDIFREYILENKVPTPVTKYRPRTRIYTLLEIFRLIGTGANKSELRNKSKYGEDTIENAIQDLHNFFQVEYTKKSGQIIAQESLVKLEDDELADYLSEQIKEHIVIRKVYARFKPGQVIWDLEFRNLLKEVYYPEYNFDNEEKRKRRDRTVKDYTSRMLSWFCFAGLLEKQQDKQFFIPNGSGKQKGKPSECEFKVKSTISPDQLELFELLNIR